MLKRLFQVLLFTFLCTQAMAQQAMDSLQTPYYDYLLMNYGRPTNGRPLLLFLHGSGERGNDLLPITIHGPARHPELMQQTDMVLISPLCPRGEWWSTGRLHQFLEEVVKRHKLNPNQIFVTGLSMGAFATWDLAIQYPELIKAIAPVCGGGYVDRVCKMKSVEVWAFHGEKDPVVPVDTSRKMVNTLLRCGGKAKLTIYPDAEHDSWTETYANKELYQWFMTLRNKSRKK